MNAHDRELFLKDEVYAVVGAAIEVSNVLGAGFLEAVYQEALALELKDRRIPFVEQPTLGVSYKGSKLAKAYIPDFLCFDQLIVEIKALNKLSSNEEAQLLNYMKASGMQVGVLLNFGSPRLEWKRMVLTALPSRPFASIRG